MKELEANVTCGWYSNAPTNQSEALSKSGVDESNCGYGFRQLPVVLQQSLLTRENHTTSSEPFDIMSRVSLPRNRQH